MTLLLVRIVARLAFKRLLRTSKSVIKLPGIQMLARHPSLVPSDELIGDAIQVIADDLRLGADSQNIVAEPLDQCCFPAARHSAKRVPCVAGDKTELGGFYPKLPLDVGVRLARRLMMLHAIRAEAP